MQTDLFLSHNERDRCDSVRFDIKLQLRHSGWTIVICKLELDHCLQKLNLLLLYMQENNNVHTFAIRCCYC